MNRLNELRDLILNTKDDFDLSAWSLAAEEVEVVEATLNEPWQFENGDHVWGLKLIAGVAQTRIEAIEQQSFGTLNDALQSATYVSAALIVQAAAWEAIAILLEGE